MNRLDAIAQCGETDSSLLCHRILFRSLKDAIHL